MSSFERLWLAVLVQALREAIQKNDFTYFDMENFEYIMLCSLANKNPTIFIKNINNILKDPETLKKLRKRTDCQIKCTNYEELITYNIDFNNIGELYVSECD